MGEKLQVKEWEQELSKSSLTFFAENILGYKVADYQAEWYSLLEDPKIKKFILHAPRNHAKTMCITVNGSLWFIGNKPDIRIVIVSNTATQASSFLRSIKTTVEKDEKYKECFGELMPRYPEKWTENEIIINRETKEKDPTISTVGAGGAILSKRADIIICDDILSKDNTRTNDQRIKIKEWFNDVLMPVLDPITGRLIMVGTAFNLEDLYHDLMKNDPTFDEKLRYRAIKKEADNQELWGQYRDLMFDNKKEEANKFYEINKEAMDLGAEVLWPERWSYKRLFDERLSVGTRSFNLMYQNEAISDETSVFKEAWIENCKDETRSLIPKYEVSQSSLGPIQIAMGVDLAISEEDRADWTSITTVAKTRENKLVILNRVRGHWSPAEIRSQIRGQAEKFRPSIILVEDNAFQASLVKDMQGSTALPIRGFTTTGEKFDEEVGINSLAVYVENGQMIIPANPRDMATVDYYNEIKEQMMKFPSGHTGDDLMSLWFAVTGLRSVGANRVMSVRVSSPMYKPVTIRG